LYIPVFIHDTVHMIRSEEETWTLLYVLVGMHGMIHMIMW
jgi:hypothetical protein